MKEHVNESYLIDILWQKSRKSNQQTVARELNITPQYLSEILKGRRRVSPVVARALGYDTFTVFVSRVPASGEGEAES